MSLVRRCAAMARMERGAPRGSPDLGDLDVQAAECARYVEATPGEARAFPGGLAGLEAAAVAAPPRGAVGGQDPVAHTWKGAQRQSLAFKKARDRYIEAASSHGVHSHEGGGRPPALAAVGHLREHAHQKDSGPVPHKYAAEAARWGAAGARHASGEEQAHVSSRVLMHTDNEDEESSAHEAPRADGDAEHIAAAKAALLRCLREQDLLGGGVAEVLEAPSGEWALSTWPVRELERGLDACRRHRSGVHLAPALVIGAHGAGSVANGCSKVGPPGAKRLRKKESCFWPCDYRASLNDDKLRCRRLGVARAGARLGWRKADQEGGEPPPAGAAVRGDAAPEAAS